MNRLIREDDVFRALTKVDLSGGTITAAKIAVRDIPTAYDVEAVVRELEEEWNKAKDMYSKHRTTALLFKANVFRDAIEIVKRGGRDEG